MNNNTGNLIDSIFTKMELQGIDLTQKLLYGYFFYDASKTKLQALKDNLVESAYRFVELEKSGGEYMLHIEKIEAHTRKSLFERGLSLKLLAVKFGVKSYDGFDVGNTDPSKPLISDEGFMRFINTKNDSNLFKLGLALYDYEIYDRAETVFRECINKNIKLDTSYFKLGNALLYQDKPGEGIKALEQATKINPTYLNAFFNLGVTCYDNRLFQKSVLYYQQADKLNPNNDAIIYGIAASQYALGQYSNSLVNCKKSLQLNQKNENALQLLQLLKEKSK